MYHAKLPELPRIQSLTDTRKRQLKARWLSGELPDLETWSDYFDHVRQSDFLMGKTKPYNGQKVFIANLEWITKERNFVNIWEDKYHEK